MVTIRETSPEDIEQVSAVLKQLDTEHYHLSDKHDILKFIKAGHSYVAEVDEQIVGVAEVEPVEGSWELYAISVLLPGMGIGRALVKFVGDLARQQGISKLWCWSLARFEAEQFYRAVGFNEELLLRRQFYGQDCWIFGKLLD